MAPVDDPLQGLNSIPQAPPPSALSDSQDLLSVPPYSDLAAQLDLWTHISFASDEPFVSNQHDGDLDDGVSDKKQMLDRETGGASEEMKRKRQLMGGRRLPIDQTQPTAAFPQPTLQPQPQLTNAPQLPMVQPFDLQNLFALAAMSSTPMTPDLQNMNLHNLLALGAYNPFLTQAAAGGLPTMTAQQSAPPPINTTAPTNPPPSKKSRVRKASTSIPEPLVTPSAGSSDLQADDPSSPSDDKFTEASLASPSEDKRRRNTQASARFRLKKKEREAAMEARCKELEAKVGELERECEALRRENGWLKGLVVGVTGGGQMPVMPGPGISLAGLASTAASTAKGRREEA